MSPFAAALLKPSGVQRINQFILINLLILVWLCLPALP